MELPFEIHSFEMCVWHVVLGILLIATEVFLCWCIVCVFAFVDVFMVFDWNLLSLWCYFLFQISLLEESGLLERALEELHKKESKIVSMYDILVW